MQFLLSWISVGILTSLECLRCDQNEYRLYGDLLRDHNPLERPTINQSQPVKVALGVELQQIINLVWNDQKLKWNPDDYGGVNQARFIKTKKGFPIWTPDVLLYNSCSVDKRFDAFYPSNIVVYNDGTANWIPPGVLKISCKIDITWFPFDDQSCFLKNAFCMLLLITIHWMLSLAAPVTRTVRVYECCPEPFPSLEFYLNIRRRTLYYGANLLLPSFLMSCLTILGFLLPPQTNEKIALEITVLLSICVFLSLITSITPPTSETVPFIAVYFCFCLLLVAASGTVAVVVQNIHYRRSSSHHMPPTLRAILLEALPWLLFMKRPGKTFSRRKARDALHAAFCKEENQSLAKGTSVIKQAIQNMMTHQKNAENMRDMVKRSLETFFRDQEDVIKPLYRSILVELHMLYLELKFITKRMEKEDRGDQEASDWKFAAMVIDRVCLIIFSFLIVFCTATIFCSAPHFTV